MLRYVNWQIVTKFLNDQSAFEMSELLAQRQRKPEYTEAPLSEPQTSHHTLPLTFRHRASSI